MPPSEPTVLAIDAGTTGVRALLVGPDLEVRHVAYRELTQHFPGPGLVEHDAGEIADAVRTTVAEALAAEPGCELAAVGITNQRETVVAWDRSTGEVFGRALVWQDRRTSELCREMVAAGHEPRVRELTGLVIDPYFSATKMAWLLGEGGVPAGGDLALGTVDAWVLWNLTGGPSGGTFATDVTNASRTLLCDISDATWSAELGDLFGVPLAALPEIRPSCGPFAVADPDWLGGRTGVAVAGIAGDQQAALVGQACFEPGMAKVTHGTGSFVLVNAGARCPTPAEGVLTTIAYHLGEHAAPGGSGLAYAREGAVFVAGAAIQWLRDGLGIIGEASDLEALATRVDSSEGLVLVPAFAGLGSPDFDPTARGLISGLSRGIGRAHLARATVEALALQVRDVLDAVSASGSPVTELRADGGASVMDLLLQTEADQCGVPVERAAHAEATALGAAMLAGLSSGVWESPDALAARWRSSARFTPAGERAAADALHAQWRRALERSRHWAL